MKNLRLFLMEDWLENNRFTAKYNLGESGGRAHTVKDLLYGSGLHEDQIIKIFMNTQLSDSPNWGRLDLRNTIASFHPRASSKNVLVTTGTSEALFLLFHILKLESLALAVPAFQLLYELPAALGTKIIHLPVYWNENGSPFVNEDEWIQILKKTKPKCLLINNPHNPSGLIFRAEFLNKIKVLVRSWNAYIIGDEHYRFLASETEQLGETIYDGEPNTFVTGSFIKCIGTPGLRIGWCVGDPSILALMQNEKNYTTHTVSPIIEWIAFETLKNLKSSLFKEIHYEWLENRKILKAFLAKEKNIYGSVPAGGLVTSLGIKSCKNSEASTRLIQKFIQSGVFVLPLETMEFGCYPFQQIGSKYCQKLCNINQGFGFRLGLGIESKMLFEALMVLSESAGSC